MSSTGSATEPTASMSTTTATSSITSTVSSRMTPIISSGFNGAHVPLWQPQQLHAMMRQPLDAGRTMTQLEEEVEFDLEFLKDSVDERMAKIQNVDQELDESHLRLFKMAILMDMKDDEQRLENYKYTLTYSCATIDKDRRFELKKKLSAMSSIINILKVAASDNGQDGQPLLVQPSAQSHILVQPKAAKVKPIDLPHWDGEIAKYKCFKVNFDGLIRSTNIPEHLWGPYLFESLDNKTKLYAGLSQSWQGRYEELWEHLDSRFANRWTVAAETIKATIMSTPPEENNWEAMVQYIDDQLDCMRSLDALDLSNTQLATNVLLMKLPEEFSNAIRNGIRIARKGRGNQDYKFTPEEFRDVMNDTVMSWKTTSPHLVKSTTVLHSTAVSDPQITSGTIQKYGGQGRGINRPQGTPKCYLCEENHRVMECQNYLGSNNRRRRLVDVQRCPDCTRKHKGSCEILYKCRICNGGLHYDYLCPTTQPSIQK